MRSSRAAWSTAGCYGALCARRRARRCSSRAARSPSEWWSGGGTKRGVKSSAPPADTESTVDNSCTSACAGSARVQSGSDSISLRRCGASQAQDDPSQGSLSSLSAHDARTQEAQLSRFARTQIAHTLELCRPSDYLSRLTALYLSVAHESASLAGWQSGAMRSRYLRSARAHVVGWVSTSSGFGGVEEERKRSTHRRRPPSSARAWRALSRGGTAP